MTFPNEPRTVLYEMQNRSGDWFNISPDVYAKRPTTIVDGVPSEYSLSQPASAGFHINNKTGNYSPRNPLSPLYNQIGRNTPVRISIAQGAYGMVLSGVSNSLGCAFTGDTAALSITGDLDIRVDMELLQDPLSEINSSWNSGNFDVASKFDDFDTARSWVLNVTSGKPRLHWFSAGTVASAKVATATTQLGPSSAGRKVLRAVLDVNNGAAGNDVLFYTGTSMSGPWTQLGTTITQAGTTAIFDGTAPVRLGANPAPSAYTYQEGPSSTYYSAEIRNGINGTVVANPVFSAQPLDPVPFSASNFNDAQGNNWSFAGFADAARVWYGNVDVRFCGESSSLPSRWDPSEADRYTPVDGAGLLRRLGSGSDPAPSGLKDWVLSQPDQPTSYFPLNGGDSTTYSVNLGRVGTNSLRFYGADAPAFTYGKDLNAPWLGTGMELTLSGLGRMQADVAAGDDNFALDFVFQSQHLGRLEFWVYDYPGNAWQFYINHDNDDKKVTVNLYAKDGSVTAWTGTGVLPELSDTGIHTCRLQVTTGVGGYQVFEVYIDGILRNTGDTLPFLSNPFGSGPSGYQIIYGRTGPQEPVNLAHLTVWSFPSVLSIPAATSYDFAARGFAGETAVSRMQRVATTGNIPFTYAGNGGDSMVMGPLYSESKLTQMRDAEGADQGILAERRDALGLKYRTRLSLVNQTPALTLDYTAGQIVPPFEPVDDDLFTKNDITLTRRDGGSVRVQKTDGRLSISEPPVGVGRYHDEQTINVQTDEMLDGIAQWLINVGTIDQQRFPNVTVDLGILAAAGLDVAARKVQVGDLLVIKNLSRVGIYGDVRLLVLGRNPETIAEGGYVHTITWNCAPYLGYEGAVYANALFPDSADARFDSPGSTLVSAISSVATSFQVASSGTLWTTDPAALPLTLVMEGEQITVPTITGTSSPQTFSGVTRSVNGIVKAQAAGADIRLATPSYYSLGGS